MKDFQAARILHFCQQLNEATPEVVFPLLCPVREKDWIFGWNYEMVYSVSGFAGQGCVFTTIAGGKQSTWYISLYQPATFQIELIRFTPGEMVVKIAIRLEAAEGDETHADITYEYTALSKEASDWIREESAAAFRDNLSYWEKAINHYLRTGSQLTRT